MIPIIEEPALRFSVGLRLFFAKAKRDPVWCRFVARVWKLGGAKAREALVSWLSERHREWGFDVYREDFGTGMPPEEGPERIGVAEMRHIEGFYEFWSELKRRNPGLLIDNCAGGGRRIDSQHAKASRELGYQPRHLFESIADAVHWFLARRFITDPR